MVCSSPIYAPYSNHTDQVLDVTNLVQVEPGSQDVIPIRNLPIYLRTDGRHPVHNQVFNFGVHAAFMCV